MLRFNHTIHHSQPGRSLFPIYTFTLGLIFLSDAILAYIFPVLVERQVKSQILLGLIMSFSSIIGILCDFYFPQILRKLRWASILLLGSIISLGFTFFVHFSVFTLPIIFALFAVSFWGIYYELIIFSQERFIVSETKPKFYTRNWSILSSIIFISWIIAPIFAAKLLLQEQNQITLVIMLIQLITIVASSFLFYRSVKVHRTNIVESNKIKQVSITKTFKEWKKVYPYVSGIILTTFMIKLLESAYWMFGALFAETLNDISKGEEFLILLVYTIPLTLGSFFSAYLNITKNKQLKAYSLTLAGGILTYLGIIFTNNFYQMGAVLFLANMMFAFVVALLSSQSSDIQNNLQVDKRFFIVGLVSFSASLAYIIGPIVLGFISEIFGYKIAFATTGVVIVMASLYLLISEILKFKRN